MNTRYGATLMQNANNLQGYRHVDTGIFMLDFALLGGIAEGFATEQYGWESSGKTTLAMRIAAGTLRKHPDKAVVWIDPETTFDPTWADKHGVDRSRLFYVQPESGEMAVDVAAAAIKNPDAALVIMDSLPALVPQKEADAAAEDALVALRARLVSRFCSQVLQGWHERRPHGHLVTVDMINQFRHKIVTMGDPRTLPCGNQHRFLATTMIEQTSQEILVKGTKAEGTEGAMQIVDFLDMGFKIKKSKAGNSIRNGSFKMMLNPDSPHASGSIYETPAILATAKKMGWYTGAGSAQYLATTGDHKYKSSAVAIEWLDDNPDELHKLKQFLIIKQRINMGIPAIPADGWLLGRVDRVTAQLAQAA